MLPQKHFLSILTFTLLSYLCNLESVSVHTMSTNCVAIVISACLIAIVTESAGYVAGRGNVNKIQRYQYAKPFGVENKPSIRKVGSKLKRDDKKTVVELEDQFIREMLSPNNTGAKYSDIFKNLAKKYGYSSGEINDYMDHDDSNDVDYYNVDGNHHAVDDLFVDITKMDDPVSSEIKSDESDDDDDDKDDTDDDDKGDSSDDDDDDSDDDNEKRNVKQEFDSDVDKDVDKHGKPLVDYVVREETEFVVDKPKKPTCLWGWHLNARGVCAPPVRKCPKGQVRNQVGICVPNSNGYWYRK